MEKIAKGMMIGALVGAAGLTYAMSDKRTRKRMMRDSRKIMDKAEDFVHKMDIM